MLKILSVRFSSTQHGSTGTFWHTKTWYSSKSVAPCKQYLGISRHFSTEYNTWSLDIGQK